MSKARIVRCDGCSIDLPASEMKAHKCPALEDGSNNHLLESGGADKDV